MMHAIQMRCASNVCDLCLGDGGDSNAEIWFDNLRALDITSTA